MKYLRTVILAAVILLFSTVKGYTHPHTFIDSTIECEFDSSGLKGFWINWTFDPMFTAQLIMDYDLDRSGSLSEEEVLDIRENAFSNLINYNYFTYITENKNTYRPEKVSSFSALIIGEDILYRFFIPYTCSPSDGGNRVIIAVYDDTFFCDISLEPDKKAEKKYSDIFDIKLQKRKNREKTISYDNSFQSVTRDGAVYSGFVNPEEIVVEFTKK